MAATAWSDHDFVKEEGVTIARVYEELMRASANPADVINIAAETRDVGFDVRPCLIADRFGRASPSYSLCLMINASSKGPASILQGILVA